MLDAVIVETGKAPTGTVVWLHGLGADGHDFEPVVPDIAPRGTRPLRFVFPHAPVRPVTLNNGWAMRAWYDIYGLSREHRQDEQGIRASGALIDECLRVETDRGVPPERIVLAGFSQGGVMALHSGLRFPQKLAGVIALSCYLALDSKLPAERSAENIGTPLFLAHGTADPTVPFAFGDASRRKLQAEGYRVEWHTYPIGHGVGPEEISDIRKFLEAVLP
ncbi:MAG TPA: dienelactone hydrolase family protein [Steroidobacteraceae bacterium]|nr:dienelactone hydrolase family protein [Steroidobacteraceae bacterium]